MPDPGRPPVGSRAADAGLERLLLWLRRFSRSSPARGIASTGTKASSGATSRPSRVRSILRAAERLGGLHALGRAIRARIAQASASAPPGTTLFANLDAADLEDDELFAPGSPLSRVAGGVVLEITERASLETCPDVRARVASLRKLGFRIAVDDLGAGYAGLSRFSVLEPEVVKLDMCLVQGVDADRKKQTLIRSLAKLCEELEVSVVSEGVETAAERETLRDLGCDLQQGYLFARPGRGFPGPRW